MGFRSTFYWNFSNKWLSPDGKDFVMIFTGTGSNDSWNTIRGRFDTSPQVDPPPFPPKKLSIKIPGGN
jgi:hypothetical protein